MALKIYNTQTRRLEPFVPLLPGIVTMYCCGVTVYDYCHLGHARSYINWDMVRRYLQWRGYEVTYVQNFTDIDDKILRRAQQEGVSMADISERFIEAYFADIRPLNVMDADEYPRVTDNISGIQQLIQILLDKNYAYAVDGDVYFNLQAFTEYGKLSGRTQSMMQAGASGRVAVSDPEIAKKKHPSDFALWKSAKLGEPAWDSPWGKGRPGWHIECFAMVRALLGETIDIHGGGGDLVFPHHENEIAQSEAANGKPLANYWLHNGMVTVNGEKMSKSLGNFLLRSASY
jgi:cysteinyl-tRNA synthetase